MNSTRTVVARPPALARASRGWRWGSVCLLTAIWAITQLWGILSPPLLDDADSVHVEAAREMLLRHDYVTLYADGIRYFDKPPLPYWIGAASAKIFGMHDWAFRLPLALSVLLLILWLYQLANRIHGERAGFYSALAFATCVGPYLFTRFFIPDVMVALWLTMAADLVLRMENSVQRYGRAKPWHPIAFGLVCAGCTLTKGLIGVVFPVGILFLYLLITAQLRQLWRMRPLAGTAAFLAAAVPWHWLAAVRNPATSSVQRGWFWFYFINDQINRYLNKRIPRDYDKVPLLLFMALLLVWLLPWGAWLPAALRRGWKLLQEEIARARLLEIPIGPGLRLAGSGGPRWRYIAVALRSPQTLFLVWAGFVLLFFSFSTRQEYYTIPAVPALALLVGIFLAQEEAGGQYTRRAGLISSAALFAVCGIAAAACFYFTAVSRTPPAGADLFGSLQQHPRDYALSFGHFFDLTPEALGFFKLPLIGTGVALVLGTALAWLLRLSRRFFAANLCLAFAFTAVLICAHQGLKVFYPILGSEPIAQAINRNWKPGSMIVIDGEYTNGSSLNFYTQQPVQMLNGRINGLWYGSLFPDAPPRFEDDADFTRLWNGPDKVFFMTHASARAASLLSATGHGRLLARTGGKELLVNH